MAEGFKVLGSAGEVRIDQDYQNKVLLESGSFAFTSVQQSVTITFSQSYDLPPLLMCNMKAGYDSTGTYPYALCLYNFTRDGSGKYNGAILMNNNQPYTCYWRIYGPAPAASTDTEGIRVFDGAGGVVFDSGFDYMVLSEIAHFVYGSSGYTPNPYTLSKTYVKPFVCMNPLDGFDYEYLTGLDSYLMYISSLFFPDYGNLEYFTELLDVPPPVGTLGANFPSDLYLPIIEGG